MGASGTSQRWCLLPFVLIILHDLVVAQMLEGWFNGGNVSKVQQQSAADGNKAEEHLMSKEHHGASPRLCACLV